jgi:hypothetical protein
MVREDARSNRESCIVRLDDLSDDFMAQHMRDFPVHVPIHELTGAERAGFRFDQQPALRHGRGGFIDDGDLAVADIPSDSHNSKF